MLGPGRPLTIALLLVALLAGAWSAVWYGAGVRDYIFASDDYVVGPQDVQLTPLPPWIHSDVCGEVFRGASLDGPLSIMDDDLTERIRNAFSLHPWIARVVSVRKRHPACVQVEVLYRQPVCMVKVGGDLLPVDAAGVLLPRADFSPVEASRYPLLVDIQTVPVGTVGECWGDARVVGGAEIAAALDEAWSQLNLARIAPSNPSNPGAAAEETYLLFTRGGTRILWGRAPGAQAGGEIPAAEKVARLKKYLADHGTLEGPHGPQDLDVQQLPAAPP
jgi:hypothetical protein